MTTYRVDPELFSLLVRFYDEVRERYHESPTLRVLLPSISPMLLEIDAHATDTEQKPPTE